MTFIGGLKIPENLTEEQIENITEIVFFKETKLIKSDVLFIFGAPDPKIWEKAIKIFNSGLVKDIVITGGYNRKPKMPQKDWNFGEVAESVVIKKKLIEGGVQEVRIYIETKSRHSLENVLFAKEVYDFENIDSLIFVAKEMAIGRQYRTLRKNIPQHINIIPSSYEAYLGDYRLSREDWYKNQITRDFIFDEFVRNIVYGLKGDIEMVTNINDELKELILGFLEIN